MKRVRKRQHYRALFVNRDKESKKARELLVKHKIKVQKIIVEDRKDIPRLVTSERVFLGVRGIKEYLDNWTKLEKVIAAS